MTSVIKLDVSELEPPQPMQEICQLLTSLQPGQLMHVRHRREPVPLYAILEQQQFDCCHRKEAEGRHHIWIWHKGDQQAAENMKRYCDEIDGA